MLSTREILHETAEYFEVDPEEILSWQRKPQPVVTARHVAWYLAYTLNQRASYPLLAKRFQRANHTTIWHGCHKIRRLIEARDAEITKAVADLKEIACHRSAGP